MGNYPFLLRPSGKDYLWGGNRLNSEFVKNIDMFPLAETWECSTHPEGPCYAVGGEFDGMKLASILRVRPEYLGSHPVSHGGLPILVKLIDAREKLSVQVHPTDAYARKHENGQLGKTEMWYVLDAGRDSELVYGLSRNITREELEKAVRLGTVEKYLQKVPVRKGDVFFLEAGTIHALGAGALVAEIQENSNLTYRLYDYDRTGKNGSRRPLHIEKAMEAAILNGSTQPRQPLRVLKYRQGAATELLCRCRHFEVYRMLVNTERRQTVDYQADSLSFRVLLCISGCGTLRFAGQALDVYKGDCIFVPADSVRILIHGQMEFLDIRG